MNPLRCLFIMLLGASALLGVPQAVAQAAPRVVNINTADAATLARELTGIGESRAAAIVAYRKQNGPFRSIEELTLVKGIGPGVIEQNRSILRAELPRGPAAGARSVPTGARSIADGPARKPGVTPPGR